MPQLLTQNETTVESLARPAWKTQWYFVFFIISGFCGLVYEVVWLRLAMASFGVTTALASIVISMFMAGLGLGSWGAGVLMRRTANSRPALRFYALAELLVGVSSVAVPYELRFGRSWLQHAAGFATWQGFLYYLLAGPWIALALVPWCTCMGSTFPLLMAVIRQTARESSERSFSYLYIANVVGALLGTLASAFVLIELVGFNGTLHVAGVLNAVLAISAFTMSLRLTSSAIATESAVVRVVARRLYDLPNGAVLCFLFATGMVSMGIEVVWIRQFTPYLGNVVYAFAGILAVYLLATVVGSRIYRLWVRSHDPADSLAAWSWLALFAVIPMLAADPLLPIGIGGIVRGGMRLATIALFCAAAGFLTPLLVDWWSSGDPARAGTAYAVNVVGSIVGPLVAGFLLLPWLGERGSLLVLALPLFAIAALTAFRKQSSEPTRPKFFISPRIKFALVCVVAICLFRFSHDYETRYARREVRRDYTATVIAAGTGAGRELLVNGIGMTKLTPITKYMVHMPLAFLPHPPQNGLVICFGMGTSFRSMLSWGIPTTAVDLVPSVPAMFHYYHSDAAKVLQNPQGQIIVDDGRRFLDGSNQSYDVIIVDPPPPPAAPGSSLLYSREFYDVVKQHLRPDGILQEWYPAADGDPATVAAVAKALQQSFPHVRAFVSLRRYGIHFLASMQPIANLQGSALAARLPAAAAADFLEWGPQPTVEKEFDVVLAREVTMEQIIGQAPRVPAIQDDEPINEYYLLRHHFHYFR